MITATAILSRRDDNGFQTRGRLTVRVTHRKDFACDTLELSWQDNDPVTSCYPPGTYKVVRRYTPKYGHHWWVQVPNRAYRLFHIGNFAASTNPNTHESDTHGCTLVGYGYADLTHDGQVELLRSGEAMRALNAALEGIDEFLLTVLAPPATA
jgi:hypothetical protein